MRERESYGIDRSPSDVDVLFLDGPTKDDVSIGEEMDLLFTGECAHPSMIHLKNLKQKIFWEISCYFGVYDII